MNLRPMWWANCLVGFGKPNFAYARVGATPIWANFDPQNFTPLKITLIYDLWYSFDRFQSPDNFGMSIFEIWPKYVCLYMGRGAIIGLFWPVAPLFCNILDSNMF